MKIVSSFRNLRFVKEKKVKFGEGGLVFHSMDIGAKAANIVNINEEKIVFKLSRHLGGDCRQQWSSLANFLVSFQDENFKESLKLVVSSFENEF